MCSKNQKVASLAMFKAIKSNNCVQLIGENKRCNSPRNVREGLLPTVAASCTHIFSDVGEGLWPTVANFETFLEADIFAQALTGTRYLIIIAKANIVLKLNLIEHYIIINALIC
jgi:hypothetical protein